MYLTIKRERREGTYVVEVDKPTRAACVAEALRVMREREADRETDR